MYGPSYLARHFPLGGEKGVATSLLGSGGPWVPVPGGGGALPTAGGGWVVAPLLFLCRGGTGPAQAKLKKADPGAPDTLREMHRTYPFPI